MIKRSLFALILLVTSLNAYEVNFQSSLPQSIERQLFETSDLISQKGRSAPTLFILKKRVVDDEKRLLDVLHAYGYWEAVITPHFDGEFPNMTITLAIDQGPLYHFSHALPETLGSLQPGCPATTTAIVDGKDAIEKELAECGYPLSKVSDQSVVVDQKLKEVSVSYGVEEGPLCHFGQTYTHGLKKVRQNFINRRLFWYPGEVYEHNLVACTEARLQESGLFSFVKVAPSDTLESENALPINIFLEELKQRHIGLGVSYSTDESIGGTAEWQHDNLTGRGDMLSFTAEYSEIVRRATAIYALPWFFGPKQDLALSGEVREENTPGFEDQEMSFLAKINRKVTPTFSFNYGGRYERLISTKSDNDDNYNLFSLPLQLRWDTSNRLLNPTHGTIINWQITPYQAFANNNIFFLKQELLASTYWPISPEQRVILALGGQFGSILGQTRFDVPAPKRFYAGSSTGLRGYKYLTVSPLDGTKPIGGRSMMILQIEPRYRLLDKLYLAGFFDVGNVFAEAAPQFNDKLLKSAGCGIRYLTPLGPFRVDAGFPLDRRPGIDHAFEIYASIGQTF